MSTSMVDEIVEILQAQYDAEHNPVYDLTSEPVTMYLHRSTGLVWHVECAHGDPNPPFFETIEAPSNHCAYCIDGLQTDDRDVMKARITFKY